MESSLEEIAAPDEKMLHDRLMTSPELLPLDDLGLVGPLLVIGRETSLPAGAVDLVGLARSGDVVLIEMKTGPQNPDFRAALAQLIDYGSDLWGLDFAALEDTVVYRYLHSAYASTWERERADLEGLIAARWPDITADERSALRDRTSEVLASGGFHYVVVAQRFTESMHNSVRYLNEATTGPRFHLVELIRFAGSGGESAFVAQVVRGPEARSKPGPARTLTAGRFLDGIRGSDYPEGYAEAVDKLFANLSTQGVQPEWGPAGASFKHQFPDRVAPMSVGWIFTDTPGWYGLRHLNLGYDPKTAGIPPNALAVLDAYLERLKSIPGGIRHSKLSAYQFSPEVTIRELAALTEAIALLASAAAGTEA